MNTCDKKHCGLLICLVCFIFQQAKAAERYLKRLEFHFTRVEEVQEQYEFHLKSPINSVHGNTIGSHCSTSRNVMRLSANENKRSPNNSHSLKNGNVLKELSQVLTKLEAELELLLGTLSIQLKGKTYRFRKGT